MAILYIPNKPSKIAIVGEAPGEQEERTWQPFVGPSGRLLTRLCNKAGLNRFDVYITNVVDVRPPRNKFDNLPKELIYDGRQKLKERLEDWKPNVVLAVGAKALEALTGLSAITRYRGAVIPSTLVSGLKIVATLHPANLLRGNMKMAPIVVNDISKVIKESEFPEIRYPRRNIEIVKDKIRALELLNKQYNNPVVIDIETAGHILTAFGVAASPIDGFSMCIELCRDVDVLRAIAKFCNSDIPKIYHNALYDVLWLAYYLGICTRNVFFDTMIAQHVCYPIYPKSLGFCASIWTDEPYWKCLKGNTEILTSDGWKRIDSFEHGDVIYAATSTLNGSITFKQVTVVNKKFNGVGYNIKSLRHNCWYTPEHKIPVCPVNGKEWRTIKASEIRRTNMRVSGYYSGNIKAPDFLRLVVILQADAAICFKYKTANIQLKRQRKIERLDSFLKHLGIKYTKTYYDGYAHFYLPRQDFVSDAINFLGKHKEFNKTLLNFDGESLDAFLDELPYWDGWFTYEGKAANYSSMKKQNVEWVSTIAHLRGKSAYMRKKSYGIWVVSIRDADRITLKPKYAKKEHFDGQVWCLLTNDGYFLCRFNDNIFITGNSEGKDFFEARKLGQISDWDQLYTYNAKDCLLTYEIYEKLAQELKANDLESTFKFDMGMINPLLFAMLHGVDVDANAKKTIKEENERVIAKLKYIADEVIPDVNVNSPKQLKQLFYDEWKFAPVKRQGKITTDAKALVKLESFPTPYKPIFGLIRNLKDYLKRRTFYNIETDPDGRVRTAFKVTGTISGRLSSSKGITGSGSNLQNVPKPIRRLYIPPAGHIFVQGDLSQAEARIVAALCNDLSWLHEFDEDDVHWRVAEFLFKKPRAELVKKIHRQMAKRVSHATHYQMSWTLLRELLRCDAKTAKQLIEDYYTMRPNLKHWQNETAKRIRKDHAIRTPYGRRLIFPSLITDEDIRQAIAFVPQSCCAQYNNDAWQRQYKEMQYSKILLQVHDSLVHAVPDDIKYVKRALIDMKRLTEIPLKIDDINLVIPVDFEIGYDWYNMKECTIDNVEKIYESLQNTNRSG